MYNVCFVNGIAVESGVIVIDMASVQNVLAPFHSVLKKTLYGIFPAFVGLSKQF